MQEDAVRKAQLVNLPTNGGIPICLGLANWNHRGPFNAKLDL